VQTERARARDGAGRRRDADGANVTRRHSRCHARWPRVQKYRLALQGLSERLAGMRKMLKALLCNLIAFGFVSGAYGLTIPASEDTVGYQSKLTAAANAAPNLMVDATHTAFLYFNLNEVPQDAVLRWAKLRLFLPSVRVKGAGLGVHVVTSQWDEAAASNQPTVATGTVASIGPEKLGTRRFVTVDVTSTVQSWISGGTMNGIRPANCIYR
jgi:hypothetical protein